MRRGPRPTPRRTTGRASKAPAPSARRAAGRRSVGPARGKAAPRGRGTHRAASNGVSPRAILLAAIGVAVATLLVMAAVPTSPLRRLFLGTHYPEAVKVAAEDYGLDPALVCAVIKCESNWDEDVVSHAGAVGLMQVMPDTAAHLAEMGLVDADAYSPTDLSDPLVNIEYGCAYLAYLHESLSTTEEIVAAYNAGLGAVQGWLADGGSIPEDIEYAETRAYVERVMGAYEGYRESYPDGIAG